MLPKPCFDVLKVLNEKKEETKQANGKDMHAVLFFSHKHTLESVGAIAAARPLTDIHRRDNR